MRTCIIALFSVMIWSVAAKMLHRKIPTDVEIISTASVRIMTTGRIELGPNGRAVAANVKRLRAARGLSLRALAESLQKVGRGLSADALNKIENGASPDAKQIRRVDIDDLMALSVVLGVSPVTLLLPADARGTAEITGAGEVDARGAWQWAWCNEPLTLPTDPEEADRAYNEFLLNSRPIGLYTSQGDDRVTGYIRELRPGTGDG
jgi:transcriptional regulator with XRE-family HTH domain